MPTNQLTRWQRRQDRLLAALRKRADACVYDGPRLADVPYHPPINLDHYYANLLYFRPSLYRQTFRHEPELLTAYEIELAMLIIQEEALREAACL